jgi:hypothetical protein
MLNRSESHREADSKIAPRLLLCPESLKALAGKLRVSANAIGITLVHKANRASCSIRQNGQHDGL